MPKIVAFALACIVVPSAYASAQSEPQLVGPVRDVARAEIVYPVVLDPLLGLPLTPNPQVAIEARGGQVTASARAGIQFGDISYSFVASAPLSEGDAELFSDRRRIPVPAFGFDMTHIVWRPRARPGFTDQLGTAGLIRTASGQPVGPQAPGTAPAALGRESVDAVAQAIDTTDAVAVPWVVFLSAGYKFGKKDYTYYADPHTLDATTASHLSDVAQMLIGVQFGVRADDPGYFVSFSINYSSLFQDAPMNIGPPDRLFGGLMRVDVRRPFTSLHLGVNPSFTYEMDTSVKTVETAAYWWFSPRSPSQRRNATKITAGVRVGYQSARGGAFASVFAGPVFRARP